MEKKRSIGVVILSLLIIVLSMLILISCITGYEHQIEHEGIIIYLITVLFAIGYMISGILVLNLIEFGRKAVIYLSLANIVLIPLYVYAEVKFEEPHIHSQQIEAQKKYGSVIANDKKQLQAYNGLEVIKSKEARYQIFRDTAVNQGDKIVIITWSIFMSLILLVFNLIPIFFFTRRNVKEQFKYMET